MAPERQPRQTLTRQLQYGILGFGILAMLATGGALIAMTADWGLRETRSHLHTKAHTASNQISLHLDDLLRKLDYLALVPGLAENPPALRRRMLEALGHHNSAFELAAIVSPEGRVLEAVTFYDQPLPAALPREAAVLEAFERRSVYLGPVRIDQTRRVPVFDVSLPLTDAAGEPNAVLWARINLEFLIYVLANLDIHHSGYAYLLDRRDRVVARSDRFVRVLEPLGAGQKPAAAHGEMAQTLSVSCLGLDGKPGYASALQLPRTNWTVVVGMPRASALSPLRQQIYVMLLVMSGILLGGALMGIVLARRFIRPLHRFALAADRVGQGDLQARVDIDSDTELGMLAERFNQMVVRQRDSLRNLHGEVLERRRAEEALRESEEQLRRLIDLLPVHVFVRDRDGRFLVVNRLSAEFYGMEPRELVGKTLEELHADARQIERFRAEDRQVIDSGEALLHIEDSFVDRWGTVHLAQVSKIPFRIAGREENAVLGIVVDVTEVRRAEKERHALEIKVQQTQKLESLGVLAGGIAHDFNNLLAGILGNVDLARRRLSKQDELQHELQGIETAARRAAELANQMLAYSGKGKFVVEPLELNRTVREMADLLHASISKKVQLDFEFCDEPVWIQADPTQMRQVVMNLITNASEALSGQSGRISLRSSLQPCGPDRLRRLSPDRELKPGVYACLEVEDTGCGMNEATLDKIFDPFFTTKFTGRGLGLASVLGIVRGHHGVIQVESTFRRGTCFRVLLPALEEAPPESALPAVAPARWEAGGTILLADDEDIVLDVAGRMLEDQGFTVLRACDGREALEIFRERHEEIACCILDLTMPRMDGRETMRALRRIDPEALVILSSGYAESDVKAGLGAAGPAAFLQKPYVSEDLTGIVREVLEQNLEAPR